MESHPRNMAPPAPRSGGYRTTTTSSSSAGYTHHSPQNMGMGPYAATAVASPFYSHNMYSYDPQQLRFDQQRGGGGGHYTYQPAPAPVAPVPQPQTPQFPYTGGYYAGPMRGRASSRSSAGSSESSRSPPVLDDTDVEGRRRSSIGYPFPPGPAAAAAESVYAESLPETLVNGGTSEDSGLQGPHRARNLHRPKRRPSNQDSPPTNGPKFRKNKVGAGGGGGGGGSGGGGGGVQETYVLRVLEDDLAIPENSGSSEEELLGVPLSTLADDEYRSVFAELNELFCRTSYRWLAQYKFRIPRKRYMKDHVSPFDRELTEYVQIIKNLVEGRSVPRDAVLDDRLNELVSIMEGASEIRHVNIHVSRKHKPDRRVLGFIAAVNEFCWILGDQKGAMKTNQMYARVEALTLENRRKFYEEKKLQAKEMPTTTASRNGKSKSPSPDRNTTAAKEVSAQA